MMRKKFTRVKWSTPARELLQMIEKYDQTAFPVVDHNDAVIGLIRFQDIRPLYQKDNQQTHLLAQDIMTKDVPVLDEHDSLDKVLKTFELTDTDTLPVVSLRDHKKLVGIVRHEDALRRYRKEILLRSEQ
jgi:CIC family chloride channel protein